MSSAAGAWRATLVAALFTLLLIAAPAQAIPGDGAFDASRLPAATAELVDAAAVPPGFTESVAISGLTAPTAVRFAADGRVFVAEKSGLIKVFDSLSDPTPTVFADLRTNVHNFWDRGPARLSPSTPTSRPTAVRVRPLRLRPALGGTAPRWGARRDLRPLPDPPGRDRPTAAWSAAGCRGCTVVRRLETAEQVLVEDWCQQYPSHSHRQPRSSGRTARCTSAAATARASPSPTTARTAIPHEPVRRPADRRRRHADAADRRGRRAAQPGPAARAATRPGLDGTVIRGQPGDRRRRCRTTRTSASADPNARRIIAHGLAQPVPHRPSAPGTNEMWVGDVGWNTLGGDRPDHRAADAVVENFGWPCYEGTGRQAGLRRRST